MAINDVTDSVVQVATSLAGTYATIADLTSWDGAHSTENVERRKVFGQAYPYTRIGDESDTYNLSGLLNLGDTAGQNILRTARDNRTSVWLRVLPEGLVAGDKGYTQECRVAEYTDAGDAEGDYVECSFSLEGVDTKVPYTVPA